MAGDRVAHGGSKRVEGVRFAEYRYAKPPGGEPTFGRILDKEDDFAHKSILGSLDADSSGCVAADRG